jgi:hypothetical protein
MRLLDSQNLVWKISSRARTRKYNYFNRPGVDREASRFRRERTVCHGRGDMAPASVGGVSGSIGWGCGRVYSVVRWELGAVDPDLTRGTVNYGR